MVTVPVPPIPKDAAKDFHDQKIVIIGAGVAGLFAANTLKYLGVDDYVVLEASDRVGGRLKRTSNDPDSTGFQTPVPLDLGAEWIHAADERMVKDLLVFPHDAEKELLPEEFVKYQPSWTFASNGCSDQKSTNKVLQALYQETKWKRSTWWDWLNTHVYTHVQDKVRLNSAVQKIVYGTSSGSDGGGADSPPVTVRCQDGTEYKADKVICTIPLAVLKQGDAITTFDPPLPQPMRAAIDAIDMPPGCRILFRMKEKFYPDVTVPYSLWEMLWNGNDLMWIYDAFYGKDLESNSNNNDNQGEEHVLAFVVVGNKHAQLLGGLQGDDESIAKAALATIDQVYDGQGTKNYISHTVQNWTTEPYVLGAYSLPESLGDLTGQLTGLGSGTHRRALGKTLDDQILFAGEHTSLNYFSLVPGAALEGRRAAVEAVSGVILK